MIAVLGGAETSVAGKTAKTSSTLACKVIVIVVVVAWLALIVWIRLILISKDSSVAAVLLIIATIHVLLQITENYSLLLCSLEQLLIFVTIGAIIIKRVA